MSSFKDFIEVGWDVWKLNSLQEAEIEYPGGGGTPRMPIIFDEEDWLYLIQFPPQYWTQALKYRYNEGLLRAAQKRETEKELPKSLKSTVKEHGITLSGAAGHTSTFMVQPKFDALIEKLEKPIFFHKEYQINPFTKEYDIQSLDGKPLADIDPTTPEYWKDYKGGLYDFDLSKPKLLSKKIIEELDRNSHWIIERANPQDFENGALKDEAFKRIKTKLLEDPPAFFAGMSAIRESAGETALRKWYLCQGLGILGEPQGRSYLGYPIAGVVEGEKILGNYEAYVGKIPLKFYYIEKEYHYLKSGRIAKDKLKVPILMKGKILPQIHFDDKQKEEIKKRINPRRERGEGEKKSEGNPKDLLNILRNYDILTPEQKEKWEKSNINMVDILLMDYNRKKYYPMLAQKFGIDPVKGGVSEEEEDSKGKKRRQEYYYYSVGFNPNKTQKSSRAINMTKEQIEKVAQDYYPVKSNKLKIPSLKALGYHKLKSNETKEMYDQNAENINGLVGNAYLGVIKYIDELIQMIKNNERPRYFQAVVDALVRNDFNIAKIAGALLIFHANDPRTGIYDKELGLTNLDPEIDKDREPLIWRANFAYNFTSSLTQSTFEPDNNILISRRQLASLNRETLEALNSIVSQKQMVNKEGETHDFSSTAHKNRLEQRRSDFNTLIDQWKETRIWDRRKGIVSPAYLLSKAEIIPFDLQKLLYNTRKQIERDLVDSEFKQEVLNSIDTVDKSMINSYEVITKTRLELFNQVLGEKGIDSPEKLEELLKEQNKELTNAIMTAIENRLPEELVKRYPEIFQKKEEAEKEIKTHTPEKAVSKQEYYRVRDELKETHSDDPDAPDKDLPPATFLNVNFNKLLNILNNKSDFLSVLKIIIGDDDINYGIDSVSGVYSASQPLSFYMEFPDSEFGVSKISLTKDKIKDIVNNIKGVRYPISAFLNAIGFEQGNPIYSDAVIKTYELFGKTIQTAKNEGWTVKEIAKVVDKTKAPQKKEEIIKFFLDNINNPNEIKNHLIDKKNELILYGIPLKDVLEDPRFKAIPTNNFAKQIIFHLFTLGE